MREREVERKLITAVKRMGGMCPKLVSPGFDGMPDRLLLMPGGLVAFVEVKKPGGKPTPLQVYRHSQLRQLGMQVYVLDDPEQIQTILGEICRNSYHMSISVTQ
ncbi:nuclease [Clostridia bacterium]|nr:nuclease [Clostridia bacterium]